MIGIENGYSRAQYSDSEKTAIIMVGLPARGKSTIAREIEKSIPRNCCSFNAGQKRRQLKGTSDGKSNEEIFNMDDPAAINRRDEIALDALTDMLRWLEASVDNKVGIFDATNSTRERRRLIVDTLTQTGLQLKVIFIEVIVDSEALLKEHLYWKVRTSEDYKHLDDKVWCQNDFKSRMTQYEAVYETLTPDEFCTHTHNCSISSFKIINRFQKCHMYGTTLPSFMLFTLLYLQRQGFLKKNGHLPTSKVMKRTPTAFANFAPWTWLKLRKLL